jgi:hypothetical protein
MAASLVVAASSSAPLSYQWQFYGTNIFGATNSTLTFTSVELTNAGVYSVLVSNSVGVATSSNAVLQVLPPDAPSIQVNGQLTVGTVTVVDSAQVTIAGGFPNGYIFYTLNGTVPSVDSLLYSDPVTLSNSATVQAMSLSADFSATAYAPPVQVQITTLCSLQTSVVGSGTITVSPPAGPYLSNSVVILTATPAPNWLFAYWTNGAAGNQNPLSLTMDGPQIIGAVFTPTYPVTAGTPGGGSVTVNGQVIAPATYFAAGTVLTLAATPNTGWSFLGWQGNATGTNNPLSVTVNGTNNLEAVFGTVVATNAVGSGEIVLNLPNPVPYGTTLTASAVPNVGKYFVTWNGAASGTNSPTQITVTSANPTVSALFTTLPVGAYSLGVVVTGIGTVAISPQQNYYPAGASVTLGATPVPGATSFYGWTQDASGTNSPIEVVMNSNQIVQASFGALPIVSVSPPNVFVVVGSNAVLTANAAGVLPLTYQWQDSEGIIGGQTNAIFAIINAQATNSDAYSVVVSNLFGSVTSEVATVTVVFPPSITSSPSNQIAAAGSSLTLAVSATGTAPLVYRWQDGSGFIPGQTNSTLVVNPALTNDTDEYSVVVSNLYGVATSSVASVLVYQPVSVSSQPASLVVLNGASATFAVMANGFPAPTGYQWIFNGTNLPGATSSTLAISNVRLQNTGNYQVQVGNGYSLTTSSGATLNIQPTITSPFTGATTIWGNSASIMVGAVGSGTLSYQWYFNGQAIVGATEPELSFSSIQITNGGLYSVVVNSPYGSVTNLAAQVIVNPAGVTLGFYPGLTITGFPGYSYILQSSTNLADTNSWLTQTNLILSEPVQLWIDTSVDASSPFNPKTFYKILPGQ